MKWLSLDAQWEICKYGIYICLGISGLGVAFQLLDLAAWLAGYRIAFIPASG